MTRPQFTRLQRTVVGGIAAGALLLSLIGFAGSYAAVRDLAMHKGFGLFAYVFPVGVDVGIGVLLALDLVLTWMRIPLPLLRQAAWLLTAATIAFNAASGWPDVLATGMHAIIPILFIVVVEAARHAIGRIADITADRHMESVRLIRWVLSPVPTFRLWRRMKLWELRSYDEVVRLEQNRLVYRTHLRAEYGRLWRRSAPVELLLPLKLARYGVPLPAGVPAARSLDDYAADAEALNTTQQPELTVAPVVGNFPTTTPEPGDTEPLMPSIISEPSEAAETGTQQPPAEPELSPLEQARLARIEKLRQARQDAARTWHEVQGQPEPPSLTQHAKQIGISVPTLRKAIDEFPAPASS